MRIDIITVLPELLKSPFDASILKRAIEKELVEVHLHNLRDFSLGNYNQVDDYQFGGGAGMVLMLEPIDKCISKLKAERDYDEVIYMSPDGETLKQGIANESIIQFCRDFPKLSGKIRFNEDEDKIVLDTQVSKDLFLKMLMDNYLTSELTELHYESLAKDSAEAEPEVEETDAEE